MYIDLFFRSLNSRQNLRMMIQGSVQVAQSLQTVTVQQDSVDSGSITETATERGNRYVSSDVKLKVSMAFLA